MPFWPKPISIFGLSSVRRLRRFRLGSPYHAPLVPDHLDAGSRDLGLASSNDHPSG